MKQEMNEAIWMKLLQAQNAQEAAEILRAEGGECTPEDVPHLWQEIERSKADLKQAGKEEAVFMQKVSPEEMEIVAGGKDGGTGCTVLYASGPSRNIYGGRGFPNCKATVEDGSWCSSNDACFTCNISYTHMKDCTKAWR